VLRNRLTTCVGVTGLAAAAAGTIASAAYSLLSALFSPQHGSMPAMAAALLPRLTPLIVGTGSPALGKRTAADLAGDRSAALGFVTSALRCVGGWGCLGCVLQAQGMEP
jgi:hypothetical protein